MTIGFTGISANAVSMVLEYSRSVISTLAPPWPSMNASVAASRRVFSVFSTAPHIGTPKCAS